MLHKWAAVIGLVLTAVGIMIGFYLQLQHDGAVQRHLRKNSGFSSALLSVSL